jgi:hypothetical protein
MVGVAVRVALGGGLAVVVGDGTAVLETVDVGVALDRVVGLDGAVGVAEGAAVTDSVADALGIAVPVEVALGVDGLLGVAVDVCVATSLAVGDAGGVALATAVAVGVARHPSSANETAATSSSMVITPSPFASPAGQRATPVPSSAMFTKVTSSEISTAPSPLQSPVQAALLGAARVSIRARTAPTTAGRRNRIKRNSCNVYRYRVSQRLINLKSTR